MSIPAIRPKLRPDAPLVQCDCDQGRVDCQACGGEGLVAIGHPNDPRSLMRRCDECFGRRTIACRVCEGTGSFPDPTALAQCRCGGLIDEEDNSCVECGFNQWEIAR